MKSTPFKNNFKIKYKNINKLEHYLNSHKYVVFSTEKYINIDNTDFSLPLVISKSNYNEMFDRAQINNKVIIVGKKQDTIKPYRELQSRNKNVYLIVI